MPRIMSAALRSGRIRPRKTRRGPKDLIDQPHSELDCEILPPENKPSGAAGAKMKTVKKFTGSQGSWEVRVDYTDGTKEVLPCAHKYHLDGLCYNDPWSDELRALPRYQRHIDLIREKRKVVLTTDDTPAEGPRFKRTGRSPPSGMTCRST